MRIIAIIPARGGSKGIPRKNIQLLSGKPLIAHTITQALKAELVNRVIVSTDDTEIADIAKRYGAEVVCRPKEISGDTASSEDALLHTLDHLEKTEEYIPDLVVFLQCTSPLTTSEDIDGTIDCLLKAEADTALAVTDFHYFLWKHDSDGNAVGIDHDKNVRLLRQQREPQYLETGAVYVMKCDQFKKNKHRFFGKTEFYVTPRERCFEIDDMTDFAIAQTLMRLCDSKKRVEKLGQKVEAVVFDFDGVFTDNKVSLLQTGDEAVTCNRSDGLGVSLLRELGIPLLVLSTEKNNVVQKRCKKLQLECINAVDDKLSTLKKWLKEKNIDPLNVVFVGNDINDLECLKIVGCPIVVADAFEAVKHAAKIILKHNGGNGAVREVADMIVSIFGKD